MSNSPAVDKKPVDRPRLEETLLQMVGVLPEGKTLAPSDIAQAVGGKAADEWGPLMQPLRHIAVRLAREGRLAIYRKGVPVDPSDFKGVYRLGAVRID